MNRLALALSLAFLVLGCPRSAPVTTVAGTDDEKIDTLSAQLEELRTKQDLKCPEWCTLKPKVCELSKQVCEIAGRLPDRAELQKKCVTANEDCARFSDGCSSCDSH